MKLLRTFRAWLAFTLIVSFGAMAVLSGCGSASSGGGAPDAGTGGAGGGGTGGGGGGGTPTLKVTVSASPATITAGDAGTLLVATVTTESNAAVSGATVTFTVDSSSVAVLSRSSSTTSANGVSSSVTLTGKRAGPVTVTARVSGAVGTGSGTTNVAVAAPVLTISETDAVGAPDDSIIAAGLPSGAGAQIKVAVKDQHGDPLSGKTVAFSTTMGNLDVTSPITDVNGEVLVKLTSTQVGSALVSGAVLGASTPTVTIVVEPGAVDSLTLTPSVDLIAPNDSCDLSVSAMDKFLNPIAGTVHFSVTAGPGSVDPADVALTNGTGSATFSSDTEGTATITASMGAASKSVVVRVERTLAGQPSRLDFSVSTPTITVKGGGGVESSTISVTVLDVNSAPVTDTTGNIRFRILRGPPGVLLDGIAGVGQSLTRTTSAGKASVGLQSGSRPGTVDVEVRVVLDKDGLTLNPPLVAVIPQVTVRAGEPASVFLSEANAIESPGDQGQGTISHDFKAVVSDLWGNAVPDGRIVYFSQFKDMIKECRNRLVFAPYNPSAVNGFVSETCTGAAAGSITPSADPLDPRATFTSGSRTFDGVQSGDLMVILTESNPKGYGGYIVSEITGANTLKLESDFEEADTGLEWAIGNAVPQGGVVFTPGDNAATLGGVATWKSTYAGELVNSPVYVFAETDGGTHGHARYSVLSWKADTTIVQLSGPENGEKVTAGATVFFQFLFEDASTPTPYALPALAVLASVTGGQLSFDAFAEKGWLAGNTLLRLETTARSILLGSQGGLVSFLWTAPPTAAKDDEFTISVSGGGQVAKIKVVIQ